MHCLATGVCGPAAGVRLLNSVRPRHTQNFHVPIRHVVPEMDGETTGDVTVQITPVRLPGQVVGMIRGRAANRFEAGEPVIAISLAKFAEELQTSESINSRGITRPPAQG